MRLIDADVLEKDIEEYADKVLQEIQGRRNGKTFSHAYLSCLAFVKKRLEEQESANTENWILCTDKLPEESDYYMACVYDEEADDYDYRKNWFAHADDYDMDESEWRELIPSEKVVAWMPLPRPPKGVANDD